MDEQQSFFEGFQRGGDAVVGPAFQPPDIDMPPPIPSGSRFMQGLILGIEAGKKKIDELT